LKRINISITDEQFSRLVDLAAGKTKEKGSYVGVAAVIREAIDKYLEEEKRSEF
jgi:predicted DNA-binding protein